MVKGSSMGERETKTSHVSHFIDLLFMNLSLNKKQKCNSADCSIFFFFFGFSKSYLAVYMYVLKCLLSDKNGSGLCHVLLAFICFTG